MLSHALPALLGSPPPTAGWKRAACPGCKKKCMFYCPFCCIVVGRPESAVVPAPRLPISFDIIFKDQQAKSTGIHAKVLCPDDVRVVNFPDELPDYDPDTTVIGYPSEQALTLWDMAPSELATVRRVLLIDSAWKKSRGIVQHPKLRQLRHVKLHAPPRESRFWRYHGAGDGCVSTVEALRCFVMECDDIARRAPGGAGVTALGGAAQGEGGVPWLRRCADDAEQLLFFFALQHQYIQERHQADPAKRDKPLPMSGDAKRQRFEFREAAAKKELPPREARSAPEVAAAPATAPAASSGGRSSTID
jgi:hypothetical protein